MKTIAKRFEESFFEYEKKINVNEWYFSDTKELLLKGIKSDIAYSNILEALNIALKQTDDYLLSESLQFILDLLSIADTTEINEEILISLNKLDSNSADISDYSKNKILEIKKKFRLI